VRVIEYAYPGYDRLAQNEIPWWRRLFSRGAGEWEAEKQTALDLYWSLKIIAAREEGKLPAWEGIRIVRERKPDAE
jgi:hypothetical protein